MLLKYFFIFVFIYSSHVHHRQFRGWREYWLRSTHLLDKVNKRVSFQASCEESAEPSWKWYKESLRAAQESVFFGNLLLVPSNKLTSVCSTSWATAGVFLPLLGDLPVGVTILSSRRPWSHLGLILKSLLSNAACYSSHIMYSVSQFGLMQPTYPIYPFCGWEKWATSTLPMRCSNRLVFLSISL